MLHNGITNYKFYFDLSLNIPLNRTSGNFWNFNFQGITVQDAECDRMEFIKAHVQWSNQSTPADAL